MSNCPKLSEFRENERFRALEHIAGTTPAYAAWDKNGGKPMELASNGRASKLFAGYMKQTGQNFAAATQLKVNAFSELFAKEHGDWVSSKDSIFALDENGEPDYIKPEMQAKVLHDLEVKYDLRHKDDKRKRTPLSKGIKHDEDRREAAKKLRNDGLFPFVKTKSITVDGEIGDSRAYYAVKLEAHDSIKYYREDDISRDNTPLVAQALTGENEKAQKAILNDLQEMYPGARVFSSVSSFLSFVDRAGGRTDNFDVDAFGAAFNNAIWINPNKSRQDVAMHEYSHIYFDALPEDNKYKQKLISLFGTEEDAIIAIGQAGVNIKKLELKDSRLAEFLDALQGFWKAVHAIFTNEGKRKELYKELWSKKMAKRILQNSDRIDVGNAKSENINYSDGKTKSGVKLSVTGLINYISRNSFMSDQLRTTATKRFTSLMRKLKAAESGLLTKNIKTTLFQSDENGEFGDELIFNKPDQKIGDILYFDAYIGEKDGDNIPYRLVYNMQTNQVEAYYEEPKKNILIKFYSGIFDVENEEIDFDSEVYTGRKDFIDQYVKAAESLGVDGEIIHGAFEYAIKKGTGALSSREDDELMQKMINLSDGDTALFDLVVDIATNRLKKIQRDLRAKYGLSFMPTAEQIVQNDEYNIEARLDIVFRSTTKNKDGKYVNVIIDVKTSREPAHNENGTLADSYIMNYGHMSAPLSHIRNSKQVRHGLQLKMYAEILEQSNPEDIVTELYVLPITIDITNQTESVTDESLIDVPIGNTSVLKLLEYYKKAGNLEETDELPDEEIESALLHANSQKEKDNIRETSIAVKYLKVVMGNISSLLGITKNDVASVLSKGISSVIQELVDEHGYPETFFSEELDENGDRIQVWMIYLANKYNIRYGSQVNYYSANSSSDNADANITVDSLENLKVAIFSNPDFYKKYSVDSSETGVRSQYISDKDFDDIIRTMNHQKEFNTKDRNIAMRLFRNNNVKAFNIWLEIGGLDNFENVDEAELNKLYRMLTNLDSYSSSDLRIMLSEEMLMTKLAQEISKEAAKGNIWKPYTVALYRLATQESDKIIGEIGTWGMIKNGKHMRSFLSMFTNNRSIDSENVLLQMLMDESRHANRRIVSISRAFRHTLDKAYSKLDDKQKAELLFEVKGSVNSRKYFLQPEEAKGKKLSPEQYAYLDAIYHHANIFNPKRSRILDEYINTHGNVQVATIMFNDAYPVMVPDKFASKKEFKEQFNISGKSLSNHLLNKIYKEIKKELLDSYIFSPNDKVPNELKYIQIGDERIINHSLGEIKAMLDITAADSVDEINEKLKIIRDIRNIIDKTVDSDGGNARKYTEQGGFDPNIQYLSSKFHEGIIANMNTHISNHYRSQVHPFAEYIENQAGQSDEWTKDFVKEYIDTRLFKENNAGFFSTVTNYLGQYISFAMLGLNAGAQIFNFSIGQIGNNIYQSGIAKKGYMRIAGKGFFKAVRMMKENNIGTMIDDIYFDEIQKMYSTASKIAFGMMEGVEILNQMVLFSGALTKEEWDNYNPNNIEIGSEENRLPSSRVNEIESIIREIHGDYGWNRPLYANSPFLRLLFQMRGGWWFTLVNRTFGKNYIDSSNKEHRSLLNTTQNEMLRAFHSFKKTVLNNFNESDFLEIIARKYLYYDTTKEGIVKQAINESPNNVPNPHVIYTKKDGAPIWVNLATKGDLTRYEQVAFYIEVAKANNEKTREGVDKKNLAVMARIAAYSLFSHMISTYFSNVAVAVLSSAAGGGDDGDYDIWNNETDDDADDGVDLMDIIQTLFVKRELNPETSRSLLALTKEERSRVIRNQVMSLYFSRLFMDILAAGTQFAQLFMLDKQSTARPAPLLGVFSNLYSLYQNIGEDYYSTSRYPYREFGESKMWSDIPGVAPFGAVIKQGRYVKNVILTDGYEKALFRESAYSTLKKIREALIQEEVINGGGITTDEDKIKEAIERADERLKEEYSDEIEAMISGVDAFVDSETKGEKLDSKEYVKYKNMVKTIKKEQKGDKVNKTLMDAIDAYERKKQ